MVLESLIKPSLSVQHSGRLLWVGAFYAFIAGVLAYYTFPNHAGIAMVFFTVLSAVPFMYNLIYLVEQDVKLHAKSFFKEYGPITFGLLTLFSGFVLGYLALYFTPIGAQVFHSQQQSIAEITGQIVTGQDFLPIVMNNMKVVLLSIAFAFLYGIGALTVIVWNSSIVAAAIGEFSIAFSQTHTGVLAGAGRYLLHGIPEIAGYLVAGLAGGIISTALIHYDFKDEHARRIILQCSKLVVVSVGLILFGAVIEVFVTPLLIG